MGFFLFAFAELIEVNADFKLEYNTFTCFIGPAGINRRVAPTFRKGGVLALKASPSVLDTLIIDVRALLELDDRYGSPWELAQNESHKSKMKN